MRDRVSLVCPGMSPWMQALLTEGGTLGGGTLAATTADAHAVDDIALLGLVSEAAGLVGARGAGRAVDNVQLTKLY